MGRIAGSLRAIELEVERHRMLDQPVSAFSGLDPNLASQILSQREAIKTLIDTAIRYGDFDGLMRELAKRLDLNSSLMEILADRFLQLVRADRENIRALRLAGGQSDSAKSGSAG